MSRNSGGDWAIPVAIGIGLVALYVYFQVKAFAEWAHLDMHAAGFLLLGGIAVVAALIVALWQSWRLSKVLPWMPFLFVWFLIPALDYWSAPHVGDFMIDTDPAWYGHWWGQALIVLGLAGFGFGINKMLDDY